MGQPAQALAVHRRLQPRANDDDDDLDDAAYPRPRRQRLFDAQEAMHPMLEAHQAHPIALERDPESTIKLIELIRACLVGAAAATIRVGPHKEVSLHLVSDDEAGADKAIAQPRRRPQSDSITKGRRRFDRHTAVSRRPSAPGRGSNLRRPLPDEYRLSLGGDAGDAG